MQNRNISGGPERSMVEINLDNYIHNLAVLRPLFRQKEFMQIVKADAYGQGAYEIAKEALNQGAVYLGVANSEEGSYLRTLGIEAPILVLSQSLGSEIQAIINHHLTVSISDLDFAVLLAQAAVCAGRKATVHINIDTGMHRSGAQYTEFLKLHTQLVRLEGLEIEGYFSHFASAPKDVSFTELQINRFRGCLEGLDISNKFVHIANSGGLPYEAADFCNLVRIGISSFGVNVFPEGTPDLDLKPVMRFKSVVSQIKKIGRGESIGYDRTWVADRETIYGIVPVGYADGYGYRLANESKVAIGESIVPVLGRVSMDMVAIDVSDAINLEIGEEAILMGKEGCNTAEDLARVAGTSPYEVLCQLGKRAKRSYLKNGALVGLSPLARREFIPSDLTDAKLTEVIERAVAERLGSKEIAGVVQTELLKYLLSQSDEVPFRYNFKYHIKMEDAEGDYYVTKSVLEFEKLLARDAFIIACTSSRVIMEQCLQRSDIEYRWLMDEEKRVDPSFFEVLSVKVDDHELVLSPHYSDKLLEIECHAPALTGLIGKRVKFSLNIRSLYLKKSRQFSVFITEITRGIEIVFHYPASLVGVDTISFFSGQNKNIRVSQREQELTIRSQDSDWILPLSGVAFIYSPVEV